MLQAVIKSGEIWRVLYTEPHPGPKNMALDEAILDAVGAGTQPPTLRFYSWEPACLSLGNAQPVADVNPGELEERGWNIVRRLTGGRSILHIDELTYSITLPAKHPFLVGGVVQSYRRLSQGLAYGLTMLGIDVYIEEKVKISQEDRDNPICFEVPSHYEMTVEGKKIVGSAQARRKSGALQHGSIPLEGDISRICDVLHWETETDRNIARARVLQHAATLEGSGAGDVDFEQAAEAIQQGFEEAHNLHFNRESPSTDEWHRAAELLQTRYQNPKWTERR